MIRSVGKPNMILFYVILLTGYCHGYPDHSLEPHSMNKTLDRKNIPNLINDDLKKNTEESSRKIQNQNHLKKLLDILNTTVGKIPTAKNSSTSLNCHDEDEFKFHKDILGVPLAAELYDLVAVGMYLLKGCPIESFNRLNELSHMLQDGNLLDDIVINLSKSLEDVPHVDKQPVLTKNQTYGGLNNTVEDILRSLHVIQSTVYEEQGTGLLQCKWEKYANYNDSDEFCDKSTEAMQDLSNSKYDWSYRSFVSLVEAKLSCEQLRDECYGIFKSPERSAAFVHYKRCNEFPNGTIENLWIKNCSQHPLAIPNIKTEKLLNHRIQRRDTSTDIRVTFFSDKDYKGMSKDFSNYVESVGKDWDGRVTSFRCSAECSVIAFENEQFQGRQTSFIGNTPVVTNDKLNAISSIVVVPYKLTLLCYVLYEHGNYQGKSKRFCGDQILPTEWRRTVSSFKLECTDCSIVVYDQGYVGHFKSFDGSMGWIGWDWNDLVEAVQIRPWKYENYEGKLIPDTIFYEHGYYRGKQLRLRSSTEFVGYPMNDQISSFKCHPPCSVIAFQHANFKGDSILYEGSQTWVGKDWNDVISSVAILSQQLCVTFYKDSGFRGDSKTYCSDTSSITNSFDNQFSSLKVLDCDVCSVVVYDEKNYEGYADVFYGETSWVGNDMNDKISSFKIRPWKIEKPKRTTAVAKPKKSCVDKTEAKVRSVVEWIPFLGFFYDLATSIYYGAKGCDDVAKERAIGMAVNLGMDALTLVTGGSAAPIAFGIKTGVKFGVKAGLKAVVKAGTAVAKNSIKNAIKTGSKIVTTGFKTNIKTLAKSGLKSAKGVLNNIKNVPKAIKSGIKAGVSNVQKKGVKQSVKGLGKEIKNAAKKKFDDLADSAERHVKGNPAKKPSGKVPCRKRRSNGQEEMCLGATGGGNSGTTDGKKSGVTGDRKSGTTSGETSGATSSGKPGATGSKKSGATGGKKSGKTTSQGGKYKHKKEDLDRLHRAGSRAEARADSDRLNEFYENINQSPSKTFEYHNKGGTSAISIKEVTIPDTKQVKEIFQDLQEYTNKIADGGKLITPKREVDSKFGLKVHMSIGDVPFEFVLGPARDNQVYVSFVKKFNVDEPHSYGEIVRLLDQGDEITRKKHASSILEIFNKKSGSTDTLWGTMTDEQIEAAQELLVLTQVVEPVRVRGADKLARSHIKDIKEGLWKFADIFTDTEDGPARFVLAREGGVRKMKAHVKRPTNESDQKLVDEASRGMSSSSSDESKRRRRALA